MNSAPKISNSLAQQLNLMVSALLPALPPFDKTAPNVAALLKRLTESEDDQDIAQAAAAWRASAAKPLRHQSAMGRWSYESSMRWITRERPVREKSASGPRPTASRSSTTSATA